MFKGQKNNKIRIGMGFIESSDLKTILQTEETYA